MRYTLYSFPSIIFIKPCISSQIELSHPSKGQRSTADLGPWLLTNNQYMAFSSEPISLLHFAACSLKVGICSELKMEMLWYKERPVHHMINLKYPLYLDISCRSFSSCLLFPFPSSLSPWLFCYKLSWLSPPLPRFSSVKSRPFQTT